MQKIPTLFVRNPDDRRYVTDQVTPGCEWVLAGEGMATRKYDGTCVMFDGVRWWARREVKPGKYGPPHFLAVDRDETTGKVVGWEPIDQSPFARFHAEAVHGKEAPGTYELCGPRINGNPEHWPVHVLFRHEEAEVINLPRKIDFRTIARAVSDLATHGFEGIVWHHPDGRMVKIKARDFPKDDQHA